MNMQRELSKLMYFISVISIKMYSIVKLNRFLLNNLCNYVEQSSETYVWWCTWCRKRKRQNVLKGLSVCYYSTARSVDFILFFNSVVMRFI